LRAHAVALVLLLGASVLCAFLPQGSSQATTILAYEPPVLLMALGAFSLLARAPKALWATPLIAGGALLALGALAEQRGREGEYLILLACALGALLMASAWALRHERRARQQ
jgi:peptidoglycan/LPS O-acetylase OafA/YrhL